MFTLRIDTYLNINLRLFLLSFLASHRIIHYLIIHITLSVYGFQKHMPELLKKKKGNKENTKRRRLERTSPLFTQDKYKLFLVSSKQLFG